MKEECSMTHVAGKNRTTDNKITVVLIDDHPALCFGLRVLIDNEPDMEVVGEANNGDAGIELVTKLSPDIAILDCKLPEKDGINVAEEIKKSGGKTKILVMSSYTETLYIKGMLKAKVSGYLLKDEAPPQIINAIRMIMNGKTWYSQSIAAKIADIVSEENIGINVLSRRELEVLEYLASGLSNQKIADKLFVSGRTIRFHLRNIYQKLYITSRSEAIVWAIQYGLNKKT